MNNWKEVEGKLEKEFKFQDFKEAVNFIDSVAEIANEMDHHPDILLHDYKLVTFTLFTHKENKITDKDHQLAEEIDRRFKEYNRIIL